MSELKRLTKIVNRMARRYGVSAAVYASGAAFDVFCEKWVTTKDGGRDYMGCIWIKSKTNDAYTRPATVAKAIRSDMRAAW